MNGSMLMSKAQAQNKHKEKRPEKTYADKFRESLERSVMNKLIRQITDYANGEVDDDGNPIFLEDQLFSSGDYLIEVLISNPDVLTVQLTNTESGEVTLVKMLWDERYLYFYTELEEQHIWADIKERDKVIFYNNDFEIFIKTSKLDKQYAEFEVNALGTIWDLLLFNTYRHKVPVINQWDMKEVKVAVNIDGTLNDPKDIDKRWSIEIALPLKDLAETGGISNLPSDGTQWLLNFSRVQWQYDIINGGYQRKKDKQQKYLPEANWVWSPQGIIAMHHPETWGTLQFSTDHIGTDVFQQDQDELVKQSLFYLYRQQLEHHKLHGDYAAKIAQLISLPFIVNDTELKPRITKTHMGYEIFLVNPNTAIAHVINQEGQLKKL